MTTLLANGVIWLGQGVCVFRSSWLGLVEAHWLLVVAFYSQGRLCGAPGSTISMLEPLKQCGYVDMRIRKDVDQQGCGSAKTWISKDVDQQRYELSRFKTVLQEWPMLLRFLRIDGAHWPVDRGSLRMYVLLVAVKLNFGYSTGGCCRSLETLSAPQESWCSRWLWICGYVDMWISKTFWIFVTRRLTTGAEYEYEYEYE
ncbi:hypothetical protein O0I10_004421 [Lichtheimia ornata]|uniref:Uncharacterized protein n=1 Tax=Lichtheimia ornata TaxID=688661 RepID=A0AAD7Y0H7_9FUNG|nr:uncharacterized protein O0I10_004421 [Lichtheimia ornata]KAJ8659828.1 hypothetical protein O0I10_004421 [Lichtheimia ornata]